MTSEPLQHVETELARWVSDCVAHGWLSTDAETALEGIERTDSGALFAAPQFKPLVVGLFGGTGVGKSSLLNRIAGESVARVGVERPTSHEVTLYVHRDVGLAELPNGLPLEKVRMAWHSSDSWRDIAWIDAPDLDSVDEQNRRCTLAWLPHIDVLIYVVSPERYRDDVGWRLLLERRERHGWVFVVNRCDEGAAGQTEDFAAILQRAGFEEPVIVRTSCQPGKHACDRFDDLVSVLRQSSAENAGQAIALRAMAARARDLRRLIEGWASKFGSATAWDQVRRSLEDTWQRVRESIEQGTEYSITLASNRIAAWSVPSGKSALRAGQRLVSSVLPDNALTDAARTATRAAITPPDPEPPQPGQIRELVRSVWDEWSDEKLSMMKAAAEVQVAESGAATAPVAREVHRIAQGAAEKVRTQLETHVRAALAQPGTRWQRSARRVTGFLTIALPGAALCWVAYAAVMNFHRGVSGGGAFAGTEFLVSAAVLVFVAWALPFAADRLLKPSLERAAADALRAGRDAALRGLGLDLESAITRAAEAGAARWKEVAGILGKIDRIAAAPGATLAPTVRRMLSHPTTPAHLPAKGLRS